MIKSAILFAVLATSCWAAESTSGLSLSPNETKAAHALISLVFPAEIQVKSAGYQDADDNKVGEYMFLTQLAGRAPTNKVKAGSMRMLSGPLADGLVADGYGFVVILPGGDKGLIVEADPIAVVPVSGAGHREQFYAAMAWPIAKDQGAHAFLLMPDGRIRYADSDAAMPAATSAVAYDSVKGTWSSPWKELPRDVAIAITYDPKTAK